MPSPVSRIWYLECTRISTWIIFEAADSCAGAVDDICWSGKFLHLLDTWTLHCSAPKPCVCYCGTSRKSLELVPRQSSLFRLSNASESREVSSRNFLNTGIVTGWNMQSLPGSTSSKITRIFWPSSAIWFSCNTRFNANPSRIAVDACTKPTSPALIAHAYVITDEVAREVFSCFLRAHKRFENVSSVGSSKRNMFEHAFTLVAGTYFRCWIIADSASFSAQDKNCQEDIKQNSIWAEFLHSKVQNHDDFRNIYFSECWLRLFAHTV